MVVLPVLERPLQSGDAVAVVDDDAAAATTLRWMVEEAGYEAVLVPPHPRSAEHLIAQITNVAVAAISDHRLGQASPIPYSGAEVVAKSNINRIPAILITSYANSDENTTIREWRSGIPQLLNRGPEANNPEAISQALTIADGERRGIYLPQREAYRTVVRVEDTRPGPAGLIAEVIVTAWRPQQTISIPASMLRSTKILSARILRGRRFMADVNIYADSAGELFFQNFEPAPDVPQDWLPSV